MARFVLTAEAAGQAARLPKVIRARIDALVRRMEKWPHVSGVKSLAGKLAGRYRLRTGDYRVQFYVVPSGNATGQRHAADDLVVIERVGHRDEFYEG
jgi:mRNA-degrading endonuclease RelE of RelBE toxin-antitoxin system